MPNIVRTKANQKRLDSALASFHTRYSAPSQYGHERWNQSLLPALTQSTSYVALLNAFVPRNEIDRILLDGGVLPDRVRQITFPATESNPRSGTYKPTCLRRNDVVGLVKDGHGEAGLSKSKLPFPLPIKVSLPDGQCLLSHWNLDAASVLAALLVEARPGDKVLDLCSAPGGKAVVLAQCIFHQLHCKESPVSPGPSSTESQQQQVELPSCLHVNEPDSARNKRLASNLQSYLPSSLFLNNSQTNQPAVKVFKLDLSNHKTALSSLPHGGTSGYDKVLVDAPCSSERHILHAHVKAEQAGQISEEMMNWKASHSLTLAKTQAGLLMTALRAVKFGGRIVYATCALGREENDGVIETVRENLKRERKKSKNTTEAKNWDWDVTFEMLSSTATTIDNDGDTHELDHSHLDAERDTILDQMTEPTKYGRIALPDRGGWGPLYFCVMTKVHRGRVKRMEEQKDGDEEDVTKDQGGEEKNEGEY